MDLVGVFLGRGDSKNAEYKDKEMTRWCGVQIHYYVGYMHVLCNLINMMVY